MRSKRWRLALLLAMALAGAGCGPIGPLAGGRLSCDPVVAPVSDWGFAAGEETLQLESRPEDPHSVNTWFVGLGGRLYVPTSMILGPKDTSQRSWVAHVSKSPQVRLRILGKVYERRAVRVMDEAEYAEARDALEAKYELDPKERDPERTIWIFRMDSRQSAAAR